MKKRNILSALSIIILLCPVLHGQYKNKEGTGSSGEVELRPRPALLFQLKNYGFPQKTAKRINKRLRSGLYSLQYCELIPGGTTMKKCSTLTCALEEGKRSGADRVIYGYISKKTDIEKKRLGEKGIKKYIIKSEEHVTCIIIVKTVDVAKGTVIYEAKKEAKPGELDTAIDKIALELELCFPPVKHIVKKKPEEKTAVKTVLQDKDKKEETAQKGTEGEKHTPEPGHRHIEYSLALYMTSIYPMGEFSDIISFAAGPALEGRIRNTPLPWDIEFRPLFGYFCYTSEKDSVNSYRSFYLTLSAGYAFKPYNRLTITPLAGAGYIIHSTEGDGNGTSGTYYDPLISFRCSFDYSITDTVSLAVIPGYVIFFETNNTGFYPSIDLGAVYRF